MDVGDLEAFGGFVMACALLKWEGKLYMTIHTALRGKVLHSEMNLNFQSSIFMFSFY